MSKCQTAWHPNGCTKIRTQIIKVGEMRILVENGIDEFAIFQHAEEFVPRLEALPARVAEVVETLLVDGFIGSFDDAVTTAELLLEVPDAAQA